MHGFTHKLSNTIPKPIGCWYVSLEFGNFLAVEMDSFVPIGVSLLLFYDSTFSYSAMDELMTMNPVQQQQTLHEVRRLIRSKMYRCKRCKNRFIEKNLYERHLRDRHLRDYEVILYSFFSYRRFICFIEALNQLLITLVRLFQGGNRYKTL